MEHLQLTDIISYIITFVIGGGITSLVTLRVSKKQLEANAFATIQDSYEKLIGTLDKRVTTLEEEVSELRKISCLVEPCKKRKVTK